jgi:hypothetical protein
VIHPKIDFPTFSQLNLIYIKNLPSLSLFLKSSSSNLCWQLRLGKNLRRIRDRAGISPWLAWKDINHSSPKFSGSVSSLSTTVSYFPFDRLHPVYATVPRDHETKRRLETVELQRFQLTPSQRKWTIDRTAGSQCEVEDCIFLRRIQELRDKADDKDAGLCWTKRTAANMLRH